MSDHSTWHRALPDIEFDISGYAVRTGSANDAYKAPRSDLAVLAVSGGDAASFLHSQFAADINALGDGQAVLTAWCSPQGRVMFLPWVMCCGDTFYLLIPHELCANLQKRLGMFVLRADVAIEDVSAASAVFEIRGAGVADVPGRVCTATAAARQFVLAPAETLSTTWNALDLPGASEAVLKLRDVDDAIPRLAAATSDRFLPQELDLDTHGGLSFDKGCYPGQEIIARVRYRGRLKRRLAVMVGDESTGFEPGTRLMSDSTHRGTVLMAALDDDATLHVLAVLDEGVDAVRGEQPGGCILQRRDPGESGLDS